MCSYPDTDIDPIMLTEFKNWNLCELGLQKPFCFSAYISDDNSSFYHLHPYRIASS